MEEFEKELAWNKRIAEIERKILDAINGHSISDVLVALGNVIVKIGKKAD
jgi:hypothetical protein